ncbi:MAG: hypothetical protein COA69_09440 [Robiginitomaculum sp.]|nr:MAG: hypothetical protein COA69_09440 [Robiginitomaculum sp.]
MLIDPRTNKPFTEAQLHPTAMVKSGGGDGFIRSLGLLDSSPRLRAQNPMENHTWVFAAVMARARNIGQTPFFLWNETESATRKRARVSKNFVPKRGRKRMAIQRHLTKSVNPGRFKGFKMKELETNLDHPLSLLFHRPNPFLSQSALFQITEMWMGLRGECIWVLLNSAGQVGSGSAPEEIWPMSPELFEPRLEGGRMIGWWFKPDARSPLGGAGARIPLGLNEVVQFKYPNPKDPYRGISPLSAAANGIDLDMLIEEYNRRIVMNGAEPGGILTFDGDMDPDEQKFALEKWNQRHEGGHNQKRTAILKGGWNYQQLALSPKDLEYAESKRWNRDGVLAILGTPKSIVGITDDLNYATQKGQDKNFWDKTLLPDVRLIEDTIDSTIMFEEPDDIVGAFDLSNIESLREGMDQQVTSALKLMGVEAHMPPRVAFELVGLTEIPDYEGDDVSLIPGLTVIPTSEILSGSNNVEPEEDPSPKKLSRRSKSDKSRIWKNFIKVQSVWENRMRKSWREWATNEERLQLAAFDSATKGFSVGDILLPVEDLQERLSKLFRPHYTGALQSTLELFEAEIGGVAIFELDDPRIQLAFEQRIALLRAGPPMTFSTALSETLLKGLDLGETVQELRARVSHVTGVAKSSSKALQVARTESGGFMNSARDAMQKAQGFTKFEWVAAGDEHVRNSHTFFENLGPVDIGFNYLDHPDYKGSARGILEFPGDPRAGAGEVVNCRCLRIVVA